MTLDKYIEIPEGIRKEEGGQLEVSRLVQGRQLIPRPRVANFNSYQCGKEVKQIKMLLMG